MSKPLISIIVPIYNVEKYLPRCIESIIEQTYKNLEIFLVDDGSTDSSGMVCEEYKKKDKRIRVLHKKNAGVSSARNHGLKFTKGDYVMFVDADDKMLPNCIEECLKIIKKNDVDIVKFSYFKKIGFLRLKYKTSYTNDCLVSKKQYRSDVYCRFFSTYDFSNVWSLFLRADLAKSILFKNYALGEDSLYSMEAILNSESMYVTNKPFYIYTINNNSITHSFTIGDGLSKLKDSIAVYKRISKKIGASENIIMDRIINIANSLLTSCALNCKKTEYIKYLSVVRDYIKSNFGLKYVELLYGDDDYDKLKRRGMLKKIVFKILKSK